MDVGSRYARTSPASRMPAARSAAYRCSTTSALPNHCALGRTFSSIHCFAADVSGEKRKIVPSLRTRASGRTLFTMSLVGPNQSLSPLLLEQSACSLEIGTHQERERDSSSFSSENTVSEMLLFLCTSELCARSTAGFPPFPRLLGLGELSRS